MCAIRNVQIDGLLLLLEPLGNRHLHLFHLDAQQFGHGADVGHVGHQFAQPGNPNHLRRQLAERNGIVDQVIPNPGELEPLFVEHDLARVQCFHVLTGRLRVHRDQEVHFPLAADVASSRGSNREPRGQSRDIGGEKVLAAGGNAHLEDGPHQDVVGTLASGTVYGGNLNTEVVHHARLDAILLGDEGLGLCDGQVLSPPIPGAASPRQTRNHFSKLPGQFIRNAHSALL